MVATEVRLNKAIRLVERNKSWRKEKCAVFRCCLEANGIFSSIEQPSRENTIDVNINFLVIHANQKTYLALLLKFRVLAIT